VGRRDSRQAITVWELEMILAFPNISLVVCALCLLIAVVAGVYRHWCKYLWIRTAIVLVANAGDEKPEQLRLGAYVPAWKSIKVRIGSWLLVAACSTLGAAWGAVRGFGIGQASKYFLGILLTRWLLSALLGRSVANYTLRVAQSFPDREEVCHEALEFCGFTQTNEMTP
jgi:hypothetical protein